MIASGLRRSGSCSHQMIEGQDCLFQPAVCICRMSIEAFVFVRGAAGHTFMSGDSK